MIEKIISSGHTGPERAALDAAIRYGVPHAGWIHHFRSAEREKLLNTYNLTVIPALDPRAAIRQNITHADGTLIFTTGRLKGDSDFARHVTLKRGIQLLGIDTRQYSQIEAASLIASWMQMNHVDRIYVTGSDGDSFRRTYNLSRKILDAAITLSYAKPAVQKSHKAGIDRSRHGRKDWPATVPEAVDTLIADLFLKDRSRISAMEPVDLDELHPTLGLYIRETFGLLNGNHELIRSCMRVMHATEMIPDEASTVIIKALWKKLQITHKLRVVP